MRTFLRLHGGTAKRHAAQTAASVVAACLAALMLGACNLIPPEEDQLPPPLVEPPKIEYKTEVARRGTLVQQKTFGATFYPEKRETVSFPQSARLKSMDVRIGDQVKAGDLLAEQDTGDLDRRIQLQKWAIEKAEIRATDLRLRGADNASRELARIDLEIARFDLDELNRQREAARVVSPIDGEIAYLTSTPVGEVVRAFDSIAMIIDERQLVLLAKVDSNVGLQIGSELTLELQRKVYEAEVVATPATLVSSPEVDLRSMTILRILGPVPEEAQRGRTVTCTFIQEERENVIVVPRNVVKLVSGRRYVHVLQNNVRVERDVEIGLQTDTEAEIVKGIDEGDLLVIN